MKGGTPGGKGGGMKGAPGGGGKKGGRPAKGGDVVRWSLPPKSSGGDAGDSTGMCMGERGKSPLCSKGDWSPEEESYISHKKYSCYGNAELSRSNAKMVCIVRSRWEVILIKSQ